MKITYDSTVDAAYITLNSEKPSISHGFTYCCDPSEVNGQIHLDFDDDERLVGIEVLQASLKLPKKLIEKAKEHN